jgi:UDP-N-acetylglucosamine 2-epimerase
MNGTTAVLKKHKSDLVIIHGDTTTTYVASLASYYQKIDVCCIEAKYKKELKIHIRHGLKRLIEN